MEEVFQRQKAKSLQLRSESIVKRKTRLQALEDWILRNRLAIQKALSEDFDKVPQETDLSETYVALTEIREARKNLRKWTDPLRAKPNMPFWGTRSYVQYEPKGVCLIISPWNFPFQLAVGPLVSAIAAGNTAIIKPSEFTPATSALLKGMCSELFEEDVVAVFLGDHQTSEALLRLPFDHIFFTGSPRVGKIVMEAASKHLASVTLELGGKSPVFIDETADISDAAEKLAWAKWMNCGQTCTAPDYILIHVSKRSELIGKLRQFSKTLYQNGEGMTKVINEKHKARLEDLVEDAIGKGAELVLGDHGEKIQPVVLDNVPTESQLMKEEIFGPVLPIIPYDKLEDAIEMVNDGEKPLSLYIFSKNRKNIQHVLKQTSSGSVAVNDAVIQFGHPELPFGGVNNSGFGKSHGKYGFIAFSNEKAVLRQRIGLTMAKTLYPPYTPLKNWTIDFLLKYF